MLRPARARRASRPHVAAAQRRLAGRPWQIVLIALGLLLAQGPMLLHLLLVPHVTCEHGELVEGAREPAPPASAESRSRSDQAQIERAHGDGTGHDHCDALAVRHCVPEIGASVAAASLVWIAPVEDGAERAEVRPVPLLSLAPKGSPPPV